MDGGCNDARSLRFAVDVSRDIYSNTNVHARVEISRTSENQKKNKCG